MLGKVDAGRDGPGANKADEVGPEPDSDLEQPLATRPLEVREPVNVGVELVSSSLHLGEELGRALLCLRMLGSAGLLFPEIADPLLLIYC